MLSTDSRYQAYIDILKEELVPAMGCTEPIAIAFAAAKARAVLGQMPDRVEISVSGNIIKNVKSVIVPNTGGLKGIEAAAAAGITVGDADRVLEVLATVSEEDKRECRLQVCDRFYRYYGDLDHFTDKAVAALENEYSPQALELFAQMLYSLTKHVE